MTVPAKAPELRKGLTPSRSEKGLCEYVDLVDDIPGQSARVYMFWRNPA
jgi:hypothetical protein